MSLTIISPTSALRSDKNEDIVQTRNITKKAYNASIQEILESEIKSSEINT